MTSRSISSSSKASLTRIELGRYCPVGNTEDVYLYTLKLLILEYINQPKFQQRASLSPSYAAKNVSNEKRRTVTNTAMEIEDSRTIVSLKDNLAKYLYNVTLGKKKVSDPLFKRCLLKFNNDTFMNRAMDKTLENLQNSEALIVFFTKAANNELNKLSIDNIQSKLYELIGKFIKILIKLLPANASTAYVNKLESYNISNTPLHLHNKRSSSLAQFSDRTESKEPSSIYGRSVSTSSVELAKKLSFKIDEIPHIGYFCQIFNRDKVIVQQHIIKLINIATNFSISKDLLLIKDQLINNQSYFRPEDFVDDNAYQYWKNYQLNEITKLLEKYVTIGRAPAVLNSSNIVIPANARDTFTSLLHSIFQFEFRENKRTFTLSQSAHFLLSKASKLWNVDFSSTLATTIYTAANVGVLDNEELNVDFSENLFSMITTKILKPDNDFIDIPNWNNRDKQQWIDNILYNARQCFVSIDDLLSALYANTKPKFSPVLSFYYSHIRNGSIPDSNLDSLEQEFTVRFKNTIFKGSEQFYKSLLTSLPKDDNLVIQHILEIVETIIKEIESLQKRYTNPLLDRVNITLECAKMLTQAIAIDGPHMLKKIEKIEKNRGQKLPPLNALNIYSNFREIRNIYQQVQKNDSIFPYKLEKSFGKYLNRFAVEIAKTVKGAFETSIQNENWAKIDDEHLYSSSALDIFKLINESLNLVSHFEWPNDYRYAEAMNTILESFSEGIQYYCSQAYKMLQKNLRSSEADSYERSKIEAESSSNVEKRKSKWNFDELKKVINSDHVIEFPQPYKYNLSTCVILNNIDKMEFLLLDLDSHLNTVELSTVMIKHEQKKLKHNLDRMNKIQSNVYSIRVKDANDIKGNGSDGLSNSFVCLSYVDQHYDIGETKVVPKSNDPVWDEVFEVNLKADKSTVIMFRIWHKPIGRFKSLKNKMICGEGYLTLNEKEFSNDGYPNCKTISLDPQGELNIEVSLETEKSNPLFNVSKSCRRLSRTRDQMTQAIVSKFSPFINIAFSRDVLKSITNNNTIKTLNDDIIYDAIVPLFDYLNANLNILAKELTKDLLFAVMLEVWASILQSADNLLLPRLEVAKHRVAQTRKSIWNVGNSFNIHGYGKPLSVLEIEIVFKWLDALCVDFFHNQGEGPSLESLKNEAYQDLLLIPIYFDKPATSLKTEVRKLTPLYYQHIIELGSDIDIQVSRKMTTVERRMTKMTKHKLRNVRDNLGEEALGVATGRKIEQTSVSRSLASLDIILRVLITKNEIDYVYEQLHERKQKLKQINIKSMAKRVAQGHKIKYRNQ